MGKLKDLVGLRFGRLRVLSKAGKNKNRNTYWLCHCDCGQSTLVLGPQLFREPCPTRSCGCLVTRTGPEHPNYRTGKSIDSYGYVRVYVPGHPNADRWGQLKEHTLVMSQMLGRPLIPGENVHHKNGVRSDNRPENLELWVVNQPAGQRAKDLVAWAKVILERYGGISETE